MIIAVGDLYALGGAATFAFSSAMIKRLNILGNAIQLNFVRTLIGGFLFPFHLLILGRFSELLDLSPLILLYLALSVIFNIVLGDTAFFESQNKLGVKIATPIVNTYPYFVIIFAVLLLGEEVTPSLILGSLVLIPGIILLSIDKIADETSFIEDTGELTEPERTKLNNDRNEEDRQNRILGLLLIGFAILCYTAGIIFTTIGTRDIGPVLANSVRLPVGSMGLFLLATTFDTRKRSDQRSDITNIGWMTYLRSIKNSTIQEKLIILVAGIFGTYLSSLFLVLSVQSIGASRSSILFSTGPFFALPLAIFWLKENVGIKTLLGTILTVIGLWIILL